MMGKVSFFMQDSMRKKYSHITDVSFPHTFQVRGRLPFPQGLSAIGVWFHRYTPSDVYAHPYFIERQCDPDQPSPQIHVTEELHGVMKVVKGLWYMHDDSSKLDNSALIVTDYNVPAVGRMLKVRGETDGGVNVRNKGDGVRDGHKMASRLERVLNLRSKPAGSSVVSMPGGGGGGLGNGPSAPVFPSATQSVPDVSASHHFFRDALLANNNDNNNNTRFVEDDDAQSLFEEREGGFTVVYNPLETNDRTFADMIAKMKREERVVAAIVVPTRQAWRHVQVWADAFPDAVIISSGPIPIGRRAESSGDGNGNNDTGNSSQRLSAGICQVMEGGMTGLVFPEVDEQELASLDGDAHLRVAAEKQSGPGVVSPASPDEVVDILWEKGASLMGGGGLTDAAGQRDMVGLRHADAHRVRVLSDEGSPCVVRLTPNIELLHIAGDRIASEYVLYDASSACLACTDLYHGTYMDVDSLNTWMCRVWFKFMKQGNHKRTDIVPRFKYRQILDQGTMAEYMASVDSLTRQKQINALVFAHGSSPCAGPSSVANELRQQWGLPPL